MKKLASLLAVGILILSFSAIQASTNEDQNMLFGNYGKSYIFVVENVEFSVFPDGQFDFTYLGPNYNTSISVSTPNVTVSYNAGYNYDMYIQYDDYGAIIQVENVPVYYDEFGRIAQVGDVEIRYANRRIVRVGGLFVHYDYYGYYSHYSGYINTFNYYYVYRPWHTHYVRPVYASCVVYDYPYRRYYSPIRYSYYDHHNYYTNRGRSNIAYTNGRRAFHKPGSRIHYKGGRSVKNKDYKSNRRNTSVAQTTRRNSSETKRKNATTSRTSKREDKITYKNTRNTNSTRVVSSNTTKKSTNRWSETPVRTKQVSYKGNTNNSKRYKSNTNNKTKKETSKSYRDTNSKEKNATRVATTSKRTTTNKNKSNTKVSSTKRGRGK